MIGSCAIIRTLQRLCRFAYTVACVFATSALPTTTLRDIANPNSDNTKAAVRLLLLPIVLLAGSPIPASGASLTGHLKLQDGTPLESITLLIASKDPDPQHANVYPTSNEMTAKDGAFQFNTLTPGRYTLSVFPRDPHFAAGAIYQNYVIPLADVEVKEGKPAQVNLTAQLGAIIKVRPVDSHGKPFDWCAAGVVSMETRRSAVVADGSFFLRGVRPDADGQLLLTPTKPPIYDYTMTIPLPGKSLQAGKTLDLGDIRFAPPPATKNVHLKMIENDGSPTTEMATFQLVGIDHPVSTWKLVLKGEISASLQPGHYHVMGGGPQHQWDIAQILVEPDKETRTTITATADPQLKRSTTRPTP